jgi:hypothetical protein
MCCYFYYHDLPQSVQFHFNVQHDCRGSNCLPSSVQTVVQERITTDRTVQLISHRDDGHYIINTHALHNAMLLRDVLPREHTKPIPLFTDRQKRHFEIAAEMRVTQDLRRANVAEKARQRRQAAAAGKPAPTDGSKEGDDGNDHEADNGPGDANHSVQEDLRGKKRRRQAT